MEKIIEDLEKLRTPAEPLKFIKETGYDKTEGLEIIAKLKEIMEANKHILTLTAPQIGINKRIFVIRFDNSIKFFIDPIITKKSGVIIAPETFLGLPNKEILISRPKEITAVYYTEDFKYEENKFIDAAARVFDQSAQVLDGILPDVLGLVSDINEDGPLADLSENEIKELTDFYKNYVKVKLKSLEKAIKEDADLTKEYDSMKFSEGVVNGRIQVISDKEDKISKKAKEIENRNKFETAKIAKAANDAQLRALAQKANKRRRK